MQSPLFQKNLAILADPEQLQQALQNNPKTQRIIASDPQLQQILSSPAMLKLPKADRLKCFEYLLQQKPNNNLEEHPGSGVSSNGVSSINNLNAVYDECCICLEDLPKDVTKFSRLSCCGNGVHEHCGKDLMSMKVGDNCPLCRAKTPTSDAEAAKYLRPWVKKKKAWAQHMMGRMYELGEGVKQSYEMAKILYERAAQQGYTAAMCCLGDMYSTGEGVEQSYEKAFEYFEQAAHLGHAEAQYNLGCLYANGQGTERDTAIASFWWTKSAAQGSKEAADALKSLLG